MNNPIIFAMANPDPEITFKKAMRSNAFIVGTGRSDCPNQINNVLVFPGIFRGALDNNIIDITDDILIRIAESLSACVKNPTRNKILPQPFDPSIAKVVANAMK